MQTHPQTSTGAPERFPWSKVPLITAYFWVIKLLTTAMGEAASDAMMHRMAPIAAVALGAVGLVLALVLQLRADRYVAWAYWLLVAMVSVFGTMAADAVHKIGLSHLTATALYGVALCLVLLLWYWREGSLDMHGIRSPRREYFYWATVFISFAFGTAAGDMTAGTLHLGNLDSGFLFAALFVAPALGFRFLGLNEIFAFWFAYVMTRPLGASFADWVAKPHAKGGLDAGTLPVALLLTLLIMVFVAYLTVTRRDVEEAPPLGDEEPVSP
ncbi:MAG TPA: hypothetical protein VL752_08645 [Acidisoma sp.]|uniref:COG4705 family protein n=1 Tax=Acidisoma sp. TaxID=1872115 RepID=UPI002CEFBA3A|nr:hypothetical protein [Acidisoma sp.]HTI01000.1 hypothetical protein [Acidisoma sp.]